MPRPKSVKSLLVETILFICLFALVGHLSVNFWERYVIQSELTKMKTSLHSLKDTINNIGVAYDHLHQELRGLAEIAEKRSLEDPLLLEASHKASSKKLLSLTEIFQNTQMQTAISTAEMKIIAQPLTEDKAQSGCKLPSPIVKNTSTLTKTPIVAEKSDKNIETHRFNNIDKTNQCGRNTKPIPKTVNGSTITRYPRKSTAIGNISVHLADSMLKHHQSHQYPEKDLPKRIYEILTNEHNLSACA